MIIIRSMKFIYKWNQHVYTFIQMSSVIWFLTFVVIADGFVPHPSVRAAGRAGDSMLSN